MDDRKPGSGPGGRRGWRGRARVAVVGGLAWLFVGLGLGGAFAQAQGQTRPRAGAPPEAGSLAPAEIQQLFDDYVVTQARRAFALTEDQRPAFLQRLRALQRVRRQALQRRHQIVLELARATAPAAGVMDEAWVRQRLEALAEVDRAGQAEIRQAYEAIDQVLDLRQQARFRVFEDQMERRKLDLVMRARRDAARVGRQ